MKHSQSNPFLLQVVLISTTFLLFSCYAGKKTSLKKLVLTTKENIDSESGQLGEIAKQKDEKLNDEKIDTSINNKIQNKLTQYVKLLDSVKNAVANTELLLSKNKTFRKFYKKEIINISGFLNDYNNNSPRRFYRYAMIKDGLSIADKRLYELAAFFGPGKYVIPEEKSELAFSMFTPLIDSLKDFSNKYSNVSQEASIIVNGFADATGIGAGSNLYNMLAAALNKPEPSKAHLNMQLSQFRATAIASLLDTLILTKSSEFKSWANFKINSYEYGQGETLPTKTITDYVDNDPRRRIVLLYWCVLPDHK